MPEQNGWEALKGLEHLNRRTRKKLWSSDKMLVHMFAGEREKKELTFLEGVDRRPPPHWLSRPRQLPSANLSSHP